MDVHPGANVTNGAFNIAPAGVGGNTLNDAGQIVFGTSQGVILFNGSELLDLTLGTGLNPRNNPPAINNSGHVVFTACTGTCTEGSLFFYDGTTINDLAVGLVVEAPFAVNNAGSVVFIARSSLPGFKQDLFLFDGTTSTRLLSITGSVNSLGLNDSGQIAFIAKSESLDFELWFLDAGQLQLVRASPDSMGGLQQPGSKRSHESGAGRSSSGHMVTHHLSTRTAVSTPPRARSNSRLNSRDSVESCGVPFRVNFNRP